MRAQSFLFLFSLSLLSGWGCSHAEMPRTSTSGAAARVFQQRRELRAQQAQQAKDIAVDVQSADFGMSSGGVGLDMDCGERTGYDCQLYVQQYLKAYIDKNQSYSRELRPVLKELDVLNVDVAVTFVELVDLNSKKGVMTCYVFIDYIWFDAFLHWNHSLTDNDGFHVVPNDLIYVPDIMVYNTIGGYISGLDAVAVFLASDGSAWWSGRGMLTTSCHFDMKEFPFDTQHCGIDFSSWIFSARRINISGVHMDVLPSFDNLAWQVDDVTSRRELVPLWGGNYIYAFGKYTVTLSRYHSHYLTSAVIPAVIISCLVLSSLWMSVHATRVSMGITGILTLIAIQWSVSSELPISDSTNWLSRFLLTSLSFIALCCVQCYVSYLMATRKHNEVTPSWVRLLVRVSLCFGLFGSELSDDDARLPRSPSRDVTSTTEVHNVLNKEEGRNCIEMEQVGGSKTRDNNIPNISSNKHKQQCEVSQSQPTPPSPSDCSWERGSRALDRMCRVLIPTAYVIFVAVELGTRV